MELGLQNKVVFISGSSKGLGKAIAESYLREGAKVCLSARGEEALMKTCREFQDRFGKESVSAFSGDLTDQESIKKCASFVSEKFHQLDVLVANVGSGSGKQGLDLLKEDWLKPIETNLVGPVLLLSAMYPLLKKQKGNIILISSIAGREALPAPVPYSVAKQGLLAITKNYSRKMAEDSVRINMVCPGNILLPGGVWERKLKENREATESYIKTEVPMNRFATGPEIADAVVFLSSNKASFTTGSSLVIDGGQTKGFL